MIPGNLIVESKTFRTFSDQTESCLTHNVWYIIL